ncbi:MAG TPA: lipoyl(octanoyl) transferase LipB [Burkholderiales bacterium]|nr:lipoyl(octanoyl) transferase LipB [Burkholderiales bacterium]
MGPVEYLTAWQAMQDFTRQRDANTPDEIWLMQHPPVYTVGLNGKSEHLPKRTTIPVIKTDRGGQITYHGPGQLVIYPLLDMRRLKLGVRPLVRSLEQSVIDLLHDYGIEAQNRVDAPGVYVSGAKIAALGLRIKNGCCYHGLALNVDMDLTPFHAINPCGHPGLQVTQLRALGIADSPDQVGNKLIQKLLHQLEKT